MGGHPCGALFIGRSATNPAQVRNQSLAVRVSVRFAGLCLVLLSLCGCSAWMGAAFYGRNEAVNPFSPGLYRVRSEIADKKEMVVRWDGHHLYEDGQTSEKMDKDVRNLMAIPLAVPGRDLFIVQARTVERQDVALYAVLERNGHSYRGDMPDCRTTGDIAKTAGAKVESAEAAIAQMKGVEQPVPEREGAQSGHQLCIFPDRGSLEAALRRYIKERQLSGALIERIGD